MTEKFKSEKRDLKKLFSELENGISSFSRSSQKG